MNIISVAIGGGDMRLADHVELFSLGGIPMVGNLETGGVIGLTGAGETLCRKMSEHDVGRTGFPPNASRS